MVHLMSKIYYKHAENSNSETGDKIFGWEYNFRAVSVSEEIVWAKSKANLLLQPSVMSDVDPVSVP